MFAHAYNIIIYRGVGAIVHGREVVDGLNCTEKTFTFNVNDNSVTYRCSGVLNIGGNLYLNFEYRHQSC